MKGVVSMIRLRAERVQPHIITVMLKFPLLDAGFKRAGIIPRIEDLIAILFNIHRPSSLLWPKREAAVQVALNGGFFRKHLTARRPGCAFFAPASLGLQKILWSCDLIETLNVNGHSAGYHILLKSSFFFSSNSSEVRIPASLSSASSLICFGIELAESDGRIG